MKRLSVITFFVFVLMMCLPLALMAQTTHLKFTQDGDFGSVNVSTNPNSNISLNVSRNSNGGNTATASINFSTSIFDPTAQTLTFTQIIGAIPNADLTGSGTQTLSLNFSTTDLDPANSSAQTCVLDLNALTFTCQPAAAGTIQATFSANKGVSNTLLISQESVVGGTTTRFHQRADTSTANVTGTIFGTSVSVGNGSIGLNHSSTLEFIKN